MNKLTIDDLLNLVKSYNPDEVEIIKRAYYYADNLHSGQKRQSGEPYIIHPLNVAYILASMHADRDTICAGLLHDTLEDTHVTKEDISHDFNPEIASLVDGVTKISKLNFSTKQEQNVANTRKIITGITSDVRIIIIKLADTLHNMRTLEYKTEFKQKENSLETMDIFVPLAYYIGAYRIKSELEDLSLRYLKPDMYKRIEERKLRLEESSNGCLKEMLYKIETLLNDKNIPNEIKIRTKNIFGIYKRLSEGHKLSDIHDLLALKIMVDEVENCYRTLYLIHNEYHPINDKFKDYICNPKTNMYQSLHTTVFGPDDRLVQTQIRTFDMDKVASFGLTAYWDEQKGKARDVMQDDLKQKFQFFKSLTEINSMFGDNQQFVNQVKTELFSDKVYVYTTKGDIIELPKGSTPIDFAYRVHTRVGETTVGAIVNNNMVPLNSELKNNDIVKIITNKNSPGPSKEWLNIVASTQAKNKIKAFFTKSERDRYIERGKDSLEKEMRKQKIVFSEFLSEENLNILLSELKLIDLDELYLSIGNGKFSASYVVNLLNKKEQPKEEVKIKHPVATIDNNIIVEGIDKVKVNIANCCSPIPGDEIVGYITKGNGISVHRKSCHNLEFLDSRMINVKWNNTTSGKFLTSLIVYSETSDKAMMDITQKAIPLGVNIDSIKTINRMDGITFQIDIYVENLTKLSKFMNDISNIKYIKNVVRVIK